MVSVVCCVPEPVACARKVICWVAVAPGRFGASTVSVIICWRSGTVTASHVYPVPLVTGSATTNACSLATVISLSFCVYTFGAALEPDCEPDDEEDDESESLHAL